MCAGAPSSSSARSGGRREAPGRSRSAAICRYGRVPAAHLCRWCEAAVFVGTLPTMTNPLRSTPKAVLRPGCWRVKKVTAFPGGANAPVGLSWMMVVPVPWRLALLLKLLTSMSPAAIFPPLGNPCRHESNSIGLTSPLAGIVDELIRRGMNACSSACAVAKAVNRLNPAARALRRNTPATNCRGCMTRPLIVCDVR